MSKSENAPMSSPSKGRKKKDRRVDRHKPRACPNCYTSLGKNYVRHVRKCKKPTGRSNRQPRLCHICNRYFDHGHLPRHYRQHVQYSQLLLKEGSAMKGDYPQIYKIEKLKRYEEPVCYDWVRNGRHKYNNTYLQYGRKSWFGLEAWMLALLNNSQRVMNQLIQGCIESRPLRGRRKPWCFIYRAIMTPLELDQVKQVEEWLKNRGVIRCWLPDTQFMEIHFVKDRTMFNYKQDKTSIIITPRKWLSSPHTKHTDIHRINSVIIQNNAEIWLLEDLVDTIKYIDSMAAKGLKNRGTTCFESPFEWEVSCCFQKEGGKALTAAKKLDQHLKNDRNGYWLKNFVLDPNAKPKQKRGVKSRVKEKAIPEDELPRFELEKRWRVKEALKAKQQDMDLETDFRERMSITNRAKTKKRIQKENDKKESKVMTRSQKADKENITTRTNLSKLIHSAESRQVQSKVVSLIRKTPGHIAIVREVQEKACTRAAKLQLIHSTESRQVQSKAIVREVQEKACTRAAKLQENNMSIKISQRRLASVIRC